MQNEYGNDSIRSLSDREAVRMRVSTYAGGNDRRGAFTTVREIISNAIDEFKAGHGETIEVFRHEDDSITVKDFGRGVPMDWNDAEGVYNYQLIYFQLNAGGKYSADNYEYAIGLNGIGSALTVLSSEWATIESVRDGYGYVLASEKGEPTGELRRQRVSAPTGTAVTWKPDTEVFEAVDFPDEWFTDYLKQQAVVNKGLTLTYTNDETGVSHTFCYPNGITDYVAELGGDGNLTGIQYMEIADVWGKDRDDKPEYKSKYEVAFTFNNDRPRMESYHNSSYLKHGGSPHEAVKTAFVWAVDRFLKDTNKYTKGEKKIGFDDIKDSLLIVTNTYSTETSYENQTKFAITNRFVKEFLTGYLKDQLHVYFVENPLDAERIANQILVNKRASEKAEQTRLQMKKKLSTTLNTLTHRIDGFVNCKSKDPAKTEFYVVEGKSALGSTKQGRDVETQAIYAIRGKILNCLKADYTRIFKNDVIMDLVNIIGCGVELPAKHTKGVPTFDLDKLRWDKIIFATDSDVDGQHIRTLLLTVVYRLMPTLIQEGRIYIVESPLYEIQHGRESLFAYSDSERDQLIRGLSGPYTIQRSKGLGENTADMMWETTMNPDTRRLIRVTPEHVRDMQKWFDLFLGDNLQDRRTYIEDQLHHYLDGALD